MRAHRNEAWAQREILVGHYFRDLPGPIVKRPRKRTWWKRLLGVR